LQVLELGHEFLKQNGISLGLRYGVCRRVVELVHSGDVPIPDVMVSLAGKDYRIYDAIMDYLRLPAGARQHLVLKGLRMHFGEMAGAVLVSRACDKLMNDPKHQEDIEWFEYSPPRDEYDFVQPLCAKNAKTATLRNPLRATKGMFEMIRGMTGLQDLTYEGPVVQTVDDFRISKDPKRRGDAKYEALPDGQTTLVSYLPDSLVRLAFVDNSFSLHQFRFGYALRDRLAKGGFPVLREVRLGSMFFSLPRQDARETLRVLQGLASLEVLELGVERCKWGGGWWQVGALVRTVERFKLARPDVQVISLLEELQAASPDEYVVSD
jgi:hypothetical protein